MKRATLLLDDTLYDRVKELSKKRGTTLKEVLNDLLRASLQALPPEKSRPLQLPIHKKNGPRPGVDVADRNALYELLEDLN